MGQKLAAYNARNEIVAFYDVVDSPAPADETNLVEITDEKHQALLSGQSAGKRMAVDKDFVPVVLDPPAPTREQIAAQRRAARDAALSASDWLISRHQDEKLIGDGTTLTSTQLTTLLKYRQALRDMGNADGWPYIDLPKVPDFTTANG